MNTTALHRVNILALIGILSNITDADYNHTDVYRKAPTCAAGWAILKRESFITTSEYGHSNDFNFINDAFGVDMWGQVFNEEPWDSIVPRGLVTRQMVIDRLQSIANGSYTPIPEPTFAY